MSRLEETFGKIKGGNPPVLPNLIEEYHPAEECEKSGDVNQIYFMGGYLGPKLDSKDQYALDVLAIILGQGASSRLYQELYENKKLVWSVSSHFMTNFGSGLISVRSVLKEGKTEEFLKSLDYVVE